MTRGCVTLLLTLYLFHGTAFSQAEDEALGARPHRRGTEFRVWAPFADSVSVTGDFNRWSSEGHPMVRGEGGVWSVDVAGARSGQGYLYIIKRGTETFRRIDPRAREVTHSSGVGIIRPVRGLPPGSFRRPSRRETVLYELHVGTFVDEPGGGPGRFDTATRRLNYLRDLGVNAVELMPVAEFAGDFSWGYNPGSLFAVERAYGGPAGMRRFVNAAHARGLSVLVDVVYNHVGPSDNALWRFDGWGENDGGGIYFYNDHRRRTPWGDTRPDYGRTEVRRYLRDNASMWLREYGVDGLRWDSTVTIRSLDGLEIPDGWRLMQEIHDSMDGNVLSIAEDLQGNEWLTRGTGAGGAGFDAQWDAAFVHTVRRALIAPDDSARDVRAVADVIRASGDPFRRVIYTESHDEVANGRSRVPEEIWPGNSESWASRKRSTLGAALVFTSPGVPMIFQGQEILEDGWFTDTDPVDWTKRRRHSGVHRLYRDLIGLRRNHSGMTRGLGGVHANVHHVNDADKVLAFHRWDQGGAGDDVVVVVNFSHRRFEAYRIGFPRSGGWRVRFNSDSRSYGGDYGDFGGADVNASGPAHDGLSFSGEVAVAPYSVLILSQER